MKIKQQQVERKLYKINLRLKNMTSSKGVKFKNYWTYMNMFDDKNTEVKVPHYIKVKFSQKVSQDDLKQIKTRGVIEVYSDKINLPGSYYKIKKDEKGNDIYPTIWIHEIESYEPYEVPHDQNDFSSNDDFKKNKKEDVEDNESIETDSFDLE